MPRILVATLAALPVLTIAAVQGAASIGCSDDSEVGDTLSLLQRQSHSVRATHCTNSVPYVLNGTDTKCAYQHSDRLFRKEGLTTDGCYHECKNTPNCHYFSIALTGPYSGVCMGCVFGVTDPHEHFKFYAMCPGLAGECTVAGDPHITGFDQQTMSLVNTDGDGHDVVDVYGNGVFWLVNSDLIHVQALYNKVYYPNSQQPINHTYMTALAVGGPFLKGHTLVLQPANGDVTWRNDKGQMQSILGNVPSDFTDFNQLVQAKAFNKDGVIDDQGASGVVLKFVLPNDVELEVNRFDKHLDMRLKMARDAAGPGEFGGQCGNYNGVDTDDDTDDLMGMMVPDSDWLLEI